MRSSRRYKLPKVSVDLAVKQVNIDLTTDVLNQLLIVQVAFIKVRQNFVGKGKSLSRLSSCEVTLSRGGMKVCKAPLSDFGGASF